MNPETFIGSEMFWLMLLFGVGSFLWLRHYEATKKTCMTCNETRTHNVFEEKPTCSSCEKNIKMLREIKAAERQEGIHICFHDGKEMLKKKHDSGIILDECPECGSVWLDQGEFKKIGKHFYDDGHSDGESSGQSSGMVTGYVVGSIIN